MTMKTLFGAAVLALTVAAPVAAAPVQVDFTSASASVTFFGLDDAISTSQKATRIEVNGVLDVYNYDIDPGNSSFNQFVFGGGAFLSVLYDGFASHIGASGNGELLGIELFTNSLGDTRISWDEREAGTIPFVGTTELATISVTPVSAVPLPAGAGLLLTGLLGVAGLKRRKNMRTA